MVEVADRISCGVAGWSYPDWNGFVYPPGLKDPLPYLAGFLDMIEINSTFYRPPAARTVASWVRRTEDRAGFFFTAKLHQDVTHRGLIDDAMAAAFREGFAPMTEAGRLRHLLAQFKYDFDDRPGHRDHLCRIRERFGGPVNLTRELRHSSWQSPSALEFVRSLSVTIAALDYPTARNSFNLRVPAIGEHAYLRLHGRNTKAWFSRDAGRDSVYNYLYSKPEVAGIAERAYDIARISRSLTVVANNHYEGKEMVNALQLKSTFAGRRIPVPATLRSRYPDLGEIADDAAGEQRVSDNPGPPGAGQPRQ